MSEMPYAKLITKIPCPKSRALLKRKHDAIPKGIATLIPIIVKSAKGAIITDIDGNRFIDFSGGIGATNSGHGNKKIINAIKNQADKFLHTCFGVIGYESYIKLCEKLNKITPGKFKKKTVLFNSGAEAVENAIKIARKYTKKQAIVSYEHGFHGRTLLTLSLTSKVEPYKEGFGPFASETYKLPYPYSYRKPSECITEEQYIDYLLKNIEEDFFKAVVSPKNIACIIIELVTGEGGFIVAPKSYIDGLKKICKKYKILLIIDEVQTGFGRTGKLFACEHYNLEPDIIITAKSLANGMPLSAVTGRAEIMDSVQEGGLGGTFIGNPLSCESALAAIDFIEKNKLQKKAEIIGKIIMKKFLEIQKKSKIVGDVRGLGAMCALEIVKNKQTKEPDKKTTLKITKYAYEHGLILLSAGILGNDIRTLMPLTIKKDELMEGLDILERAIYNVEVEKEASDKYIKKIIEIDERHIKKYGYRRMSIKSIN